MNVPSYELMSMSAIIEIQALIRMALTDDDDHAARALDALLAGKDKAVLATALVMAYWVFKPFS